MDNLNLYYPIILSENIEIHVEKQMEIEVFLKKYPFMKRMLINNVGKYIFNLCDGQNSIKDIIQSVSQEYSENPINEIEVDTLEFLYKLWRYEAISFKDKDYFKELFQINNSQTVLYHDQKDRLFSTVKQNSKNNIISEYIYGLTTDQTYFDLGLIDSNRLWFFDNNTGAYILLEYIPYFINSFTLNSIIFEDKVEDIDFESLKVFLQNSVIKFSELLKLESNIENVMFVGNNDNNTNKTLLEGIGFRKLGVIQEELDIDNKILDLAMYLNEL